MGTTTLEFRPLSKALGAEVGGVDMAKSLDDETYEALRAAWLEHQILLFREQHITLPQQIAFSRRFGDLYIAPKKNIVRSSEFPEVGTWSNIKRNGEYIGQPPSPGNTNWHSDLFHLEKPASGSLFRAEQSPVTGGETWFANMCRAYEALPAETKERIDGLRGTQSQVKIWNVIDPELEPLTEKEKRNFPDVTHPLVRTHPEFGRRALFVGMRGTQCAIVEGMDEDESVAFLDDLRAFATQPRFTYCHQWRPGDVMLWDNRCTMHRATIFDDSLGPRLCYRTTIAGDAPYQTAYITVSGMIEAHADVIGSLDRPTEPDMSAIGYQRTFGETVKQVRSCSESGHPQRFQCPQTASSSQAMGTQLDIGGKYWWNNTNEFIASY